MVRTATLVACGFLVVAGCLSGAPGAPPAAPETSPPSSSTTRPGTTTTPATTTSSTSPSPTRTSTLSAEAVGERAVAAETSRIEARATGYENLTDVSFGIFEAPEYDVLRRNATGVTVRVRVGYSVEFDCDGDGEPDSSLEGANTETTYFVTADRVRLVAVSQDVLDPEC